MALLGNDEINLINTYFDEMEIPNEEKKKRIDLCLELVDVFYYVFALINADFRLGNPIKAEVYTDELTERFKAIVSDSAYDSVMDEEEIPQYIEEISSNLVDVTIDNAETEYFSSVDRAIRVAEDTTNVVGDTWYIGFMKSIGYKYKTWITLLDGKARHSHVLSYGQTVGIDEYFDVGVSKMRYPHDCNAPAEEVVNCRCTLDFKK